MTGKGWQVNCAKCGAILARDSRFCGKCGAAVDAGDGSFSPRSVGRFALGPIVGHGGMGVVYRAHDPDLGRDVALKLIAPALADDADFRARFEAEARAAAAVDHPNVLPLFEAGEDGGDLYLAMRLVEGTDLKTILAREDRLSAARTATTVGQIAAALDAAHARGLVHRDVKPANALIAGEGDAEHVYLTDFGLTQVAGESGHLTNPGQVVGTANYVAPEQIKGGAMDGRVDVYALACVAFECLAGEPPFARATPAATLSAHLNDEIPTATSRNRALPRDVDEVLAAGLAKDPGQRFASCGAFARALGAALDTDTGVAPSDPRVALRARPRATPPPTAATRAKAPTAVMTPGGRQGPAGRGTTAWMPALAGLLGIAALGGLAAAAVAFLPSLLDRGGEETRSASTINALSDANAVNGSLSTMISRLARDPTSEAEREDQRRRLSTLRAEVGRLRTAAAGDGVDAAVRPLLTRSLRAQEQLLDQYRGVLDASPADAQPLIDEMLVTLSQAEADLEGAGG